MSLQPAHLESYQAAPPTSFLEFPEDNTTPSPSIFDEFEEILFGSEEEDDNASLQEQKARTANAVRKHSKSNIDFSNEVL